MLGLGEPADFFRIDLFRNWINHPMGRSITISLEAQGSTTLRMAIPTRNMRIVFLSSDINLVILLIIGFSVVALGFAGALRSSSVSFGIRNDHTHEGKDGELLAHVDNNF